MHIVNIELGNRDLILESGYLAKQANGAVLARYGESMVLATVCCSKKPLDPPLDYVPLQVEYNEKYYAAGKIPGGFFKREGRPREREILVSRLIDRPMRPLFSPFFGREIQLVPTTLSTDQVNPPDIIAMNAASTAVVISDIPFDGPVGSVRVGVTPQQQLILNPSYTEMEDLLLEIIVAGTSEGITMVEGGGDMAPENLLIEAIEFAREHIEAICHIQLELRSLCGKEKIVLPDALPKMAEEKAIAERLKTLLKTACFILGKEERVQAIEKAKKAVAQEFAEKISEEEQGIFSTLVEEVEREVVRSSILETKRRTDHRSPEDIRPISCELEMLPRTHGSALFTRGETQALVVSTLGTVFDEQIMDDIEGDRREHFLLHYNFPPFSVGETGRLGTGRREIGHGHLAYRALQPIMPPKSDFPYTMRVVSEILESNGSSSMATVCGGTLSLMQAGVPIKKPVAGIAMGLIKEGDSFVILSDILGEEDHIGDMDFKVAGTEEGITAFQMDIKLKNVNAEIMRQALEQAKKGRLFILDKLTEAISKPNISISPYAPKILTFQVDQEKIGMVIGPRGKTIKDITERFSVEVNIEPEGLVTIYSKSSDNAEQAKNSFMKLLEEPEVGKIYGGVVKRITDFGAFIEILPGKEGLCHISRISAERVDTVRDVLQMNQEVQVKIIEIDKMGRLNLSMILDDVPGTRNSQPSSDRGDRPHSRGNSRPRDRQRPRHE